MAGARRPEPGVVAIQRPEALAAVHGAVRRVRGFGRIDAPTRARRQRRVLVRQQPQRRRARVGGRPAHVVRLGRRPTPCHGVRLGPRLCLIGAVIFRCHGHPPGLYIGFTSSCAFPCHRPWFELRLRLLYCVRFRLV